MVPHCRSATLCTDVPACLCYTLHPMDTDAPALAIEHLKKTYGSTVAVDDISLTLKRGGFLGLLGPNGAGKSTTINCIVGITKITSGSIHTFGIDVEQDYRASRRTVGIAPQEFNVDIFSEVWKLLDYVAGYYGLRKAERRERIAELLTQFNLEPHKHKKFQELSGGLKRRVVLARALVHDPELLILDEPTAGVDVELRRELWGYLRQLSQAGKTILLTSHYLDEVELLAEDIAFINHGKIIKTGTKQELIAGGKKLEDVYLDVMKQDA